MSRYAKEVNTCLLKIRDGDKSAMTSLYMISANHLKGFIKGYLINKMQWEDVLIETYERALNYINSFNSDLDGYNWLCGIAKNLAYDFNKKEITTVNIDFVSAELPQNDWFENLEAKMDLSLATKDLGDTDKRILYLRHYKHLRLHEIGRELGVSKVAVSKRIKRIYAQIRKKY